MLVCVDTRPLLEAVLELHYVVGVVSGPVETVSIRSGVNTGEVILMEGDDYIGHCVNVAARLCDLASAGEALAAPSVMEHLPSWGLAVSETPISLRGVERPVPASSIRMAHGGPDGSLDPICGLPADPDTAEEIAPDVRGSVRAVLLAGLPRHLAPAPVPRRAGLRGGAGASTSPARSIRVLHGCFLSYSSLTRWMALEWLLLSPQFEVVRLWSRILTRRCGQFVLRLLQRGLRNGRIWTCFCFGAEDKSRLVESGASILVQSMPRA